MATVERQKVKFTGDRTGLEAIALKGHGVVHAGETIEVDPETAERWTVKHPMRDGKEGSDFTAVGGVFTVDQDKVAEREIKERERLMGDEDTASLYVNAMNVEPAHEADAGTGTVEEEAALAREMDEAGAKSETKAEPKAEKAERKADKK